jgi:nucleotidyltransferase/DNA polymerase involved in DNA repair
MKIACLWVPELSLIAALRAEPQLCAEPLAVVQAGLGGRAHVLGATGAAKGVEAGQTLAEARAICPRLLSREAPRRRRRARRPAPCPRAWRKRGPVSCTWMFRGSSR